MNIDLHPVMLYNKRRSIEFSRSEVLQMHKYLMALDQGTTSSRSIVFDLSGRIVASAQNEFPQIFRGTDGSNTIPRIYGTRSLPLRARL